MKTGSSWAKGFPRLAAQCGQVQATEAVGDQLQGAGVMLPFFITPASLPPRCSVWHGDSWWEWGGNLHLYSGPSAALTWPLHCIEPEQFFKTRREGKYLVCSAPMLDIACQPLFSFHQAWTQLVMPLSSIHQSELPWWMTVPFANLLLAIWVT